MFAGVTEVKVGKMLRGKGQILGRSGKLRNYCRNGGRRSFWATLMGM